jgi:proline iminopeptidase
MSAHPSPPRREGLAAIEPYRVEMVPVSARHTLYLEQWGNPQGIPAVALHGGPGGGVVPEMRSYFDPKTYRVVMFDQRGCGRSTPHAELDENTTWDLVADMERLREKLGIEKWVVFGGSWGACLALAYAISHPERVLGIVLWGVFFVTQKEVDWFYRDGASMLLPGEFEKFLAPIPPEERGDPVSAYYRLLTGPNRDSQIQAARAWSRWEAHACNYGAVDYALPQRFFNDRFMLAFARIECHYFYNRGFFPHDDWIMANIGKIAHIPGTILSGRLDICTPPWAAHHLASACPNLRLHHLADTPHTAQSPAMQSRIIAALDELARAQR